MPPRTSKNSSTSTLAKLSLQKASIDSISDASDEHSREFFSLLSEKYDNLNAKLDSIIERMDERDSRLERVEKENALLKQRMAKMAEKLDEADMVSHRSNLIMSSRELSKLEPGGNPVEEIVRLLKRKVNYQLSPTSILSAYRIGVKPSNQSPDSRNIMLKLTNSEAKMDILSIAQLGNNHVPSCEAYRHVRQRRSDPIESLSSIFYEICQEEIP